MHVFWYIGVCFFFKQKTAYEMRMSDWSSDVCSSDLGGAARAAAPELAALVRDAHAAAPDRFIAAAALAAVSSEPTDALPGFLRALPAELARARQSVVQGKSVSVRVEFVGRRLI